MTQPNQQPTIDESDVKTTLSEKELEALEQRTKKEEETADKVENHLEKKKAELMRRRQEAEDRKKEARKELKEVKQGLKTPETDNDSNDEPEESKPVETIVDDDDALYEKFKARQKEENETLNLQKSVDELIEKYPEASADTFQKIEELASSLKAHYPDLSPSDLVAKATYLELGESVNNGKEAIQHIHASSSSAKGGKQRSSLQYKYSISPETLRTLDGSEDDFLQKIERMEKRGVDISRYGVTKIN